MSIYILFVKTFAHELGHALGMQHDFKDGTFPFLPCYDSKAQDCLKMKGIMSYEVCHFIEMHFQTAINLIIRLLRPMRLTYLIFMI